MRSLQRWLISGLAGLCPLLTQQPSPPAAPAPVAAETATKEWTAADDHQNMLNQLGIAALRPGPSGDEKAPNAANYDESLANPFPNLPLLLTLNERTHRDDAGTWWKRAAARDRRGLRARGLGRIPAERSKGDVDGRETVKSDVGGHPVIGKQLVGRVDNSAYPIDQRRDCI